MAKYDIEVELIGQDGNAFAIMGAVSRELKRAGVSKEERDAYFTEATSGDYNHLLRVTSEWVNIV
jgi:hypothetical protein